jgi:hypothetical protein
MMFIDPENDRCRAVLIYDIVFLSTSDLKSWSQKQGSSVINEGYDVQMTPEDASSVHSIF